MYYLTEGFLKAMVSALVNGAWPAIFVIIIGTPITLLLDFIYDSAVLSYLVETQTKEATWKKSQRSALRNYLADTFAPLANISKIFFETFRPFKYNVATEFFGAVKQPAEGMAYTLSGLYRVITTPIIGGLHITGLILSLIGKPAKYKQVFAKLSEVIPHTISRTLNGAFRIIAGLTQLALTPFSLTLKPAIRGLITLVSDTQKLKTTRVINNA